MRGRRKNKEDKSGDINNVPDEMVLQILQHLPPKSLATTQVLSKRFHAISNENSLWKCKFMAVEQKILEGRFKAAYKIFWQKKIRASAAVSYKQACRRLREFIKKSEANLQTLTKERRYSPANIQYSKCLAAYKLAKFRQAFGLINDLIEQRRQLIFMYPHCRTNLHQLSDLYYWRGCIFEKLEHYEAAIANFTLYLEGEGKNIRTHLHLANCYSVQKQFDEATKHYKTYLDAYFKNNPSASLTDAPVVHVLNTLNAAEHANSPSITLPALPEQQRKSRGLYALFSKKPIPKLPTVRVNLPSMNL